MDQIQFGTVTEEVVTRGEFPVAKALETLKGETISILGYGVQGPAQALNLRDNGFQVIVGQRKGTPSWNRAVEDGWKEGVDLFSIEEAAEKGTFLCYLLSDAGQMQFWPKMQQFLKPGKTLYFSHGFAVTFSKQTGVVPPAGVDVVIVAPKGSGRSVRRLFQQRWGCSKESRNTGAVS